MQNFLFPDSETTAQNLYGAPNSILEKQNVKVRVQ